MRTIRISHPLAYLGLLLGLLFPLNSFAGNPTATGWINATLINWRGITISFDSNSSGVALGGTGSAAATLNFGVVSAYGTLASGVTRSILGLSSFAVQTPFDVNVMEGGLTSTSYTLSAHLAAPAATGLTYGVDGFTLTTTGQNVQTNGAYNTDVQHTLSLVVSTAAPGAGGPATGSALTTTIDFTATSN